MPFLSYARPGPNTLALFMAAFGSLGVAACTAIDAGDTVLATTVLTLSDGTQAGRATIQDTGEAITITVSIQGIAPGPHGFHLHTTGQCDAPDFTSAGGHLNPLGRDHGVLANDGSHVGDLPNLIARPDGSGAVTAQLPGTRAQMASWLFDEDGTSVIVHRDADDYRSDPTGNAGPRIACGVLTKA